MSSGGSATALDAFICIHWRPPAAMLSSSASEHWWSGLVARDTSTDCGAYRDEGRGHQGRNPREVGRAGPQKLRELIRLINPDAPSLRYWYLLALDPLQAGDLSSRWNSRTVFHCECTSKFPLLRMGRTRKKGRWRGSHGP